ncbi:D-threo-aldose 1-dehydrogenase [Microbacterium sp. SLBN-154]|uniref:aldo/keto reductase n=1 Tax=Microbacterium sp. SLBN-154 TaxID=2768458 RepID=UPI001150CA72|nr:aldo/keto reductase [Microbacterium sp. SLBN-154]TQK17711.1 D-threo-aldose 1-dehydrogenase [Microbacterium sp. SLBN-154]
MSDSLGDEVRGYPDLQATHGVSLSRLGLGTAQLGNLYSDMDAATARAIVTLAWDRGIRYFDTAPLYGLGASEAKLGKALKNFPRPKFTISTKVGRLLHPDGAGWSFDFSENGIRRSLDGSLHRLGMEWADIALLHDPSTRLEQAIRSGYPALLKEREAGRVKLIGAGTADVAALLRIVRETDLDVVMIAGRLTLLNGEALKELVPLCESRGVAIINAGVFNSGILAEQRPNPASRYEYRQASPEILSRARHIATAAGTFGLTLPQAALRYSMTLRGVASTVAGADSVHQLAQLTDLASTDPLPPALLKLIRA